MTAVTETVYNDDLAMIYVADMLHRAMLEAGAPVKVSEAARMVGRPDVDLRLARVVLTSMMDRFTATDRRWTAWTRYSNPSHTIERTLEDVLEACGTPVPLEYLANEVAAVHGRPASVCAEAIGRLLTNSERFFSAGDLGFGRRCWLLDVQSTDPDDVLFDNFLTAEDVAPFDGAAGGIDAAHPESIAAFLDAVRKPVPGKALQFLVWRAQPEAFDAVRLYEALRAVGAVCLSNREWIGPAGVAELAGRFADIAQRSVAEDAETRSQEAAQPLTISDTEREQLVDFVLRTETTSQISQMLEDIFEVSAGEPTFAADRESVRECLRNDPRVVWVGGDRFLPQGAIPDYAFTVPEILAFPQDVYQDLEGNDVDIMLEDDGLSGGLNHEIMSPLAQDVLDEESVAPPAGDPPVTVRCVLKFHHKEIGTFPLCQLPHGYFPTEPSIVQIQMLLPNGHRADVWVNNETRMLYGLLDWYMTVPIDSGAVFYMERQAVDRYLLTFGEETEPAMFVSRNRVNDLLELGRRAETEELPTFDILREIMEHYRKGIEFITALTEVNIARRATRRTVASLLSGHHCFFQRGKAWVFDARKLSQGFDKSKRKYMVNR